MDSSTYGNISAEFDDYDEMCAIIDNGCNDNSGENPQPASYLPLTDKPQINDVELVGNRVLPDTRLTNEELNDIFQF